MTDIAYVVRVPLTSIVLSALRRPSPSLLRCITVAYILINAIVMGFVAMEWISHLLESEGPVSPWVVPALCIVPAIVAIVPKRPALTWVATFVATLGAAFLCPVASFLALPDGAFVHEGTTPVAGILLLVTMGGAYFSIPIGFSFGLVTASCAAFMTSIRERGAAAGLDCALLTIGLASLALAAICGALAMPERYGAALAYGLGAGALMTMMVGMLGLLARSILVRRIEAGAFSALRIEAGEGDESLPRLYPYGNIKRLICLRDNNPDAGPFREGAVFRPIVRIG